MHVQHVQYGNRLFTGFLYGDERIVKQLHNSQGYTLERNQRGGEQMLESWIWVIIVLVVAAIFFGFGYFIRKSLAEAKIKAQKRSRCHR